MFFKSEMTQEAANANKKDAMRVYAVLFLLFAASQAQDAPEKCTTPNNSMGECVSIEDCPYVLKLLTDPRPRIDFGSIKSFQCGLKGKKLYVCCPEEVQGTSETSGIVKHPNVQLLPNDICGVITVRAIHADPEPQDILQYPWTAMIGYTEGNDFKYRCGGTIINERYILTAAHCINQLPYGIKQSNVRIGGYDLKSDVDCSRRLEEKYCNPPAQEYGIEEAIFHPDYKKKNMENDIGLIRLEKSVNFTLGSTKPICLPLEENPRNLSGKAMRNEGWGITTSEGESSPVLVSTEIRVLDTTKCADQYKGILKIDSRTQLCANAEYYGRDLCIGDLGGSLMEIDSVLERVVQQGVMSFKAGECKSDTHPRVYTKVAPYVKWILDSIKD